MDMILQGYEDSPLRFFQPSHTRKAINAAASARVACRPRSTKLLMTHSGSHSTFPPSVLQVEPALTVMASDANAASALSSRYTTLVRNITKRRLRGFNAFQSSPLFRYLSNSDSLAEAPSGRNSW